jgi:hypothetical protein
MQLAPVNPSAKFVTPQPLPAVTGPTPTITPVPWQETPADENGLVSVRYFGTTADGDRRQLTVRNQHDFASEQWSSVSGSLTDAVRAARSLAVVEGFSDDGAAGVFGRSSVAVLEAGKGVWSLIPIKYTEGLGDGMDAVISIPIDTAVTATGSEVSVPFGAHGEDGFDKADKVQVRFDDPRVAALVGVDSVAIAPGH